jgi:hypothetical protein
MYMPFLVVDKAQLSCSYGTCSSKLKVTPIKLSSLGVTGGLGASANIGAALGAGLGASASIGAGLGAGLRGGLGAGLGVSANIGAGLAVKMGGGIKADITVPHGLVKRFNAAGKLVAQANFEAGVPMGASMTFDAAGRINQSLMFVGGKIHGMASLYTEGVLTAAMSFNHGHMHGMSKFYDMQGRLAVQTNFSGGLEDGRRITFNVNTGAVLQTEPYVKGLLNGVAEVGGALEAGIGAGLGIAAKVAMPTVAVDLKAQLGFAASIEGNFVATVTDHLPHVNIRPFCYCKSLANPAVAAASEKAHGELTPQPCTPKTMSPWVPGSYSATLVGNPALTYDSKLICAYAGVIHIKDPGQKKASIA